MEELKKQVIEMVSRLEGGKTVNSSDFARAASQALEKKVSVTNCVPCIKSTLKELKNWLNKIETKVEEPVNLIQVEPKPSVKKIIKKDGQEKSKRRGGKI